MPKNDLVRRIDQRIGVVNNIVVPGAASWTGYTFDDAHLLRRDGARSLLAAANWLWEPGAQVGGLLQARAYGADLLARLVSNYENRYAALSVLDATYANWLFAGAADAAGTDAVFSVDNTGTVKMLRGYVGDPTALHLYADPTLLEFRNGETVLSGFDAQGRTIYGFERMGPPHGPCVEMTEFTDETGETRYKWQILGEEGRPGVSFVTGNATDPDDYRVIFGPEGATYYMKFLSGILTLAASVIILGGSIDKPLTLGLEGGIYQGSGTFAAPTTGLKLWNDGGIGRIAGYNAGVAQAYFDSDGAIKWAGGDNVANAYGLLLKASNSLYGAKGIAWIDDVTISPSGQTAYLALGTYSMGGPVLGGIVGSDLALALSAAGAGVSISANGIIIDPGEDQDITLNNSPRITGLADATADTDALNRQTGDARYAPIATAPTTLSKTTTNATPAVLLVDGTDYFTISDDTVWNFRAEIAAMTADAAGYAAYTVTGLVRRANGTVTVHGVTTTTHAESVAGWDATAVADDTNKALSIQVTGAAGTTIRWTAAVYTTEVSFPAS